LGFFDSITIFDWDGPGFGIGRRGRKLLDSGEPARAEIAGIKVTRASSGGEGSNSCHYAYALDVQDPTGAPVRLGCRQLVTPHRQAVHLGSQVVVRRRRRKVIIDWAATLDGLGVEHRGLADSPDFWKPLRKPPPAGVADHEQNGDRRRIARARPARATVLRVVALGGSFGALENVDVDVQLTFSDGSTGQALLRRIIPPDYAAYLLSAGTVLPVGVDKGGARITVDWVAAANGGTTVDASPPAALRDLDAALPPAGGDKLLGALQGVLEGAMAKGGLSTEAPEGAEIDFDTWVEVSAGIARDGVPEADQDAYAARLGVPPGRWAEASRAWQARAGSDWRLGARYGDAYQRAYQRGR
jgi:hypothetical protein